MWTSEAGGAAVMVAGTAPPDVSELWDWRLGPGDTYVSEAHRAGTRELLHVLSGSVVLVVGETEHRLGSGDSASFDGSIAHSYGNASTSRPARFTLAVYEPALSKESHDSPLTADAVLAGAAVDDDVWALRPDYRALLIASVVCAVDPVTRPAKPHCVAPRTTPGSAWPAAPPEALPEIAAWREAFLVSGSSRGQLAAASKRCCVESMPACRGSTG